MVIFSFRYAVSGYRTFSGGWSSSIETMLNEFGVLDRVIFFKPDFCIPRMEIEAPREEDAREEEY